MSILNNLISLITWRRRKDIRLGFMVRVDHKTVFEGFNRVGRNSYANGCRLGRHSYIGTECILNKTEIGRFTSIGDRVIVITGNHPTAQNISTSPAFYSGKSCVGTFAQDKAFAEYEYAKDDYYVVIGNDVWIGSDVRIMHGVSIGDGAVIGSGAIVTKDVEPYSINVGVPARKMRERFDLDTVEKLKRIQWWSWDDETLKERALYFQSPVEFVERFGGTDGEVKRK